MARTETSASPGRWRIDVWGIVIGDGLFAVMDDKVLGNDKVRVRLDGVAGDGVSREEPRKETSSWFSPPTRGDKCTWTSFERESRKKMGQCRVTFVSAGETSE